MSLARFNTQLRVKESFKPLFAKEVLGINHATVWQQKQLYILAGRAGEYGLLN